MLLKALGFDMTMVATEKDLHAELNWARMRPKSMATVRNYQLR